MWNVTKTGFLSRTLKHYDNKILMNLFKDNLFLFFIVYTHLIASHLWCDQQAKWVWTWKKIKTPFSFSVYAWILDLNHVENPIQIEHTVPEIVILVMLKTIKYKGNWKLLLALSKNQ